MTNDRILTGNWACSNFYTTEREPQAPAWRRQQTRDEECVCGEKKEYSGIVAWIGCCPSCRKVLSFTWPAAKMVDIGIPWPWACSWSWWPKPCPRRFRCLCLLHAHDPCACLLHLNNIFSPLPRNLLCTTHFFFSVEKSGSSLQKLPPFMFHPNSRQRAVWDTVIAFILMSVSLPQPPFVTIFYIVCLSIIHIFGLCYFSLRISSARPFPVPPSLSRNWCTMLLLIMLLSSDSDYVLLCSKIQHADDSVSTGAPRDASRNLLQANRLWCVYVLWMYACVCVCVFFLRNLWNLNASSKHT